jgi:hypothetical protein
MHWTDYIDIAIKQHANLHNKDIVNILSDGLKVDYFGPFCNFRTQWRNYYRHRWFGAALSLCTTWKIQDGLYLKWKNNGVPLRFSSENDYPFIDVYIYDEDLEKDNIFIDYDQLINGHIQNFTISKKDFYPLKKV